MTLLNNLRSPSRVITALPRLEAGLCRPIPRGGRLRELRSARARATRCRVVMFDVNRLKQINDTLGHKAGDELIRAAADCIHACFEGVEDVFRLGGDEFCVITTAAEDKAKACLEALEARAAAFKGEFIDGFTISYGMASDAEAPDIEGIVKEADRRMYDYKRSFYSRAGNDRRQSR